MIFFDYIQELFRCSIRDQIDEFRNKWFSETEYTCCSVTGLVINKAMSHVDHAPPNTFAQLVFSHLQETKSDWRHFQHDGLKVITSLNLWREYHREHAHLRIVYSKVNLQLSNVDITWDSLIPADKYGRPHVVFCDTYEDAFALIRKGLLADVKKNRCNYQFYQSCPNLIEQEDLVEKMKGLFGAR